MPTAHVKKWLTILCLALFAMAILAVGAQRPDLLNQIPGLGPTPTPTPVVSGAITVNEPTVKSHVGKTLTISGAAQTTAVSIRLADKLSGQIYGETTITTDEQGNFFTAIDMQGSQLRSGHPLIIEVFHRNRDNGREEDVVTIPVTFSP